MAGKPSDGAERAKERVDAALAATLVSDAASAAPVPVTRPTHAPSDTERDAARGTDRSGERVSTVDVALLATLASDRGGSTPEGYPPPSVTITSEHPARYERERELGRGGMGRVLVALDRHLGRTVAMKELLGGEGLAAELGLSIGTVARFLREARITGQLEHPGIVPVHELGRRSDGTLYYTMKRIRGRSLAAVLKESPTLEDRLRLLGAFRSVCEAMAYAHSRGVVHRDLKPDNVMVGEFGETLVVDWGLAKVRGEDDAPFIRAAERVDVLASADAAQTVDGIAMGTPAYMSPEQARGDLRSIDERADVWGLGAMLYEILTGRPPFTGASVFEVLRRVMEERPARVRELEPRAPPELAAIAERALHGDPSSRYPSGKELAAEIVAWQDGRQVRAYEYSTWERVRRFVERNRAASIAVVVVALALFSASGLIYRSYLHEEAARVHAESERDAAASAMRGAEASARRAEIAVAEALLDRSERAMSDGDPAGAAVFAAGVLLRDADLGVAGATLEPTARTRATERDVRARSILLETAERSRYVFERVVVGAHHRSVMSSDGRRIVIPTESDLRVVDLAGGGPETRVAVHAATLLALSGDRLVVDGEAPGVYALESGERTVTTARLTDAAFFEDRLALVEGGALRVVSHADGAELGRLEGVDDVSQVTWMAGGTSLAVATGSALTVTTAAWPLASPRVVSIGATPFGLSAAPSGGRLSAVILDSAVLVVEGLEGSATTSRLDTRGWATDSAWDSTGALAVLEDGERIVLFDAERARPIETLRVVATAGGRIEAAGERVALLPFTLTSTVRGATVFRRSGGLGPDVRSFSPAIRDLVVDTARHRAIVATLDGVYSVELGPRRLGTPSLIAHLPPEVGIPARTVVTPGGDVVMVTSRGALVFITGGGTVEIAIAPEARSTGGPLGLALMPDGDECLVGGMDGAVRRWSRRAHSVRSTLRGHSAAVTSIAVSPDGATIATASYDRDVRIFGARSGETLHVLSGHAELAADVAFSPDGTRLATADGVGRLRLFDTHDAHLVYHALVHPRWLNRIAWSADGVFVASASDDGTVHVSAVADLSAVRVFRTRAAPIAVAFDGARVVYHDGRELVRIDCRLGSAPPEPSAALALAEARSGLTLDGLTLLPRAE